MWEVQTLQMPCHMYTIPSSVVPVFAQIVSVVLAQGLPFRHFLLSHSTEERERREEAVERLVECSSWGCPLTLPHPAPFHILVP
jgi:hypothetical protein